MANVTSQLIFLLNNSTILRVELFMKNSSLLSNNLLDNLLKLITLR